MSLSARIEHFGTADWLSLFVVAASLCFAVFMSWRSGRSDDRTFIGFLLEGLTLAAAGVVLISVFYKPWFEALTDNKVFLVIVAVMTMSNGFRDIAENFHRSRSTLGNTRGHDRNKMK